MAQIRVERKSSTGWVWWLLGLLVLALVLWAVFAAMDNDQVGLVTEPGVVESVPPVAATGPSFSDVQVTGIPVGQIAESPVSWAGRNVSGEVRVTEVVSDRGFWIEADGQRMFVLLNEVPGEIKEINAGQTIRLTDATVHQTGDASQLPGNLDQQAQRIASGQPAVLAIDSRDVEILSPGIGAS